MRTLAEELEHAIEEGRIDLMRSLEGPIVIEMKDDGSQWAFEPDSWFLPGSLVNRETGETLSPARLQHLPAREFEVIK